MRILDWRDRAAAAFALLIMAAGSIHAEVRVSGEARAVQLDATGSTVSEALSALESAFRLRVKATAVLDRPIGGTYAGSLSEVLSRVLHDYNYFIRRQGTEIEVTVLGLQGDYAAATQQPRMASSNSPAFSLANAVRLKIH